MSDEMIDEIAIIGTEDEIRERIQADADGGVHTSIIAPLAATPEDVQRTFDAFTADKFQLR
jgi:alkanesulfonate monooxygenase SsuD/methylene tetrahydromethanopterin reductase-like flavin-dependent oxidoreductase (luciferase family)